MFSLSSRYVPAIFPPFSRYPLEWVWRTGRGCDDIQKQKYQGIKKAGLIAPLEFGMRILG
jgi:hypothetical protein